ncbi:MAG: hypothetical protein AB7F22_20940 [Reyranella sp.]|uniref:hypothetical protein n=1 Tax=Reyranella sp. TaxID=1929291 RepID=UPI003D0BD5DE
MRSIKWLIAAGLIVATTAACTEQYGYPSTAYNSGYYNTGSGYYNTGSGYYSGGRYYSNSRYAYNSTPRRGPYGDYDRDGVPNRYDRDANGDGVPDRYQR